MLANCVYRFFFLSFSEHQDDLFIDLLFFSGGIQYKLDKKIALN